MSALTPPTNTVTQRYLDLVRGQSKSPGAVGSRLALWLASLPYGLAVRVRNTWFDVGRGGIRRASVPVVSVGNLTVGGTGKTPCVEYIARFFQQRELRVAILSRGYGSTTGVNDEALVLEENLPDVPHLQGPDRALLAQVAVEELESEVVVLDDGFQHRRLARDLDVVLIDATDPWGGGHLLPRGLLREPRSSLRRAHAVLLTRCDQVSGELRRHLHQEIQRAVRRPTKSIEDSEIVIAEAVHRPVTLLSSDGTTAALDLLRQLPVAGFCGIGNPKAFAQTLRDLGVTPIEMRVYPDHHLYSRHDVEVLEGWAAQLPPETCIVTTQKDLVKLRLPSLADRSLRALRIQLAFEQGQEALEALLARILVPT